MSQHKVWDADFVGVLAAVEDMKAINNEHQPVFVNSQNYVQFYVKNMTIPPENFPEHVLFACFSYELAKYGFEDHTELSSAERVEHVQQFLADSLILFRPQHKMHQLYGEVYHAAEVRLIPKLEQFHDQSILKAIPIFSQEVHKLNFVEFKNRLADGRFIGKIPNISKEEDDTPTLIFWRHHHLNYEMFGLFKEHEYGTNGFKLIPESELRSIKVKEEILHQTYQEGELADTVLFVDSTVYQELETMLEETSPQSIERAKLNMNAPQVPRTNTTQDKHTQRGIKPTSPSFMNHFIQVTKEMGLVYNERDLYNFHTAMQSNALTILAGMSGTGKSRLVKAYGKALGLQFEQLVYIPVRPSWTDDADVIGFVDTMNMVYRPGDSGLIDTLCEAQRKENQNRQYIICFDEMNLARVEHYFSQFLSVLEMDIGQRTLRLYSERNTNQIYNAVHYPPEIRIGSNVIFVGTVNLDESTYHFSDKVLDRANVITLDIQPYSQLSEMLKSNDAAHLSEDEIEFLWQVHLTMQAENKKLGIGPRVVMQMNQYIRHLPISNQLTRKEAFDLQVVQRVLTKLRGSEAMLRELIGKLDQTGEQTSGKLFKLMLEHHTLSNFEHSKRVLIQKAKELKVNGFTI